ncbi:MAG: DMT family transporter [Elusimicrobia bacterium]|nr:DMT family transporter [Elusimicrobiota bacterium]
MSATTILTCVAVICLWGAGAYFDKAALERLDSHHLFLARFYLFFVILLMPMVLYFDEIRLAVWRADRRVLWMLAGSVTLPLLGVFLYYRALASAEASKVVPFCAAFPLFTMLLATLFLKEPLTGSKVAGTVLVVAGTLLLSRP